MNYPVLVLLSVKIRTSVLGITGFSLRPTMDRVQRCVASAAIEFSFPSRVEAPFPSLLHFSLCLFPFFPPTPHLHLPPRHAEEGEGKSWFEGGVEGILVKVCVKAGCLRESLSRA